MLLDYVTHNCSRALKEINTDNLIKFLFICFRRITSHTVYFLSDSLSDQ